MLAALLGGAALLSVAESGQGGSVPLGCIRPRMWKMGSDSVAPDRG